MVGSLVIDVVVKYRCSFVGWCGVVVARRRRKGLSSGVVAVVVDRLDVASCQVQSSSSIVYRSSRKQCLVTRINEFFLPLVSLNYMSPLYRYGIKMWRSHQLGEKK